MQLIVANRLICPVMGMEQSLALFFHKLTPAQAFLSVFHGSFPGKWKNRSQALENCFSLLSDGLHWFLKD